MKKIKVWKYADINLKDWLHQLNNLGIKIFDTNRLRRYEKD